MKKTILKGFFSPTFYGQRSVTAAWPPAVPGVLIKQLCDNLHNPKMFHEYQQDPLI